MVTTSTAEILDKRRTRISESSSNRVVSGDETPYCVSIPPGCHLPVGIDGNRIRSLCRLWTDGAKLENIALDPCHEVDKVWDHVFGCPYSRTPIKVVPRKSLPGYQLVNEDWDKILAGLNHVGRPSGDGELMRPVGKWVTDLTKMNNGFSFVEAAHALAHARSTFLRNSAYLKSGFLDCLAEMEFSSRYGLTFHCPTKDEIMTGRRSTGLSDIERLGIRVMTSTNMRKPWLLTRIGCDGVKPYQDAIVVLYGVHIEPQPWSTRTDNPNDDDESWLEMNRWSCMPSILSICGWAGVDEVCKAPLAGYSEQVAPDKARFALPAAAMDGPSSLDAYMSSLNSEGANEGSWKTEAFLGSGWLCKLTDVTPPFPCLDCLRINHSADGAPEKPSATRPENLSRERPEVRKSWEEYDKSMNKLVSVLKTACEFHYRRFVYEKDGKRRLKTRARNAKKLSAFVDSAVKREKKAKELRARGLMDRAVSALKKLEVMRNEAMAPLHTKEK